MKRILVFGGGLIGSRHVAAVQAHEECTLVGLVDPDPHVTAPCPTFRDLASVPEEPDGVIIATPTALHASQGLFAAARGWHMLIEKPVAANSEEAQTLAARLEGGTIRSLVGHHRRYHRPLQQLRRLLAEGLIGAPVTATMIWSMKKPDAYFKDNWRTDQGSPVMINAVHDIDLLRFLLGEIADCAALAGARLRDTPRIESAAIALRFASGAVATVSLSDTAPSPWGFEAGTGENPMIGTTGQDMLWITGTEGAISFPSMTLWRASDWSQAAQPQQIVREENTKEPLDAQLDHFLEVMEGAAPRIDVADASQTLLWAERIEAQLRQAPTEERRLG